MLSRPFYRMMAAMANDSRISDTNFRAAVKAMFSAEYRGMLPVDRVRTVAQNAIYETERDRYLH